MTNHKMAFLFRGFHQHKKAFATITLATALSFAGAGVISVIAPPPIVASAAVVNVSSALDQFNTLLAQYQSDLTAFSGQLNAYSTAVGNFNTAVQNYKDDVTSYNNGPLATFTSDLATYNAALQKFNGDLATYQAAVDQYKLDLAAYNANPTQSGYDALFQEYNNLISLHDQVLTDLSPLGSLHQTVVDDFNNLTTANSNLAAEFQALDDTRMALQGTYASLTDTLNNTLISEYAKLQALYNQALNEWQNAENDYNNGKNGYTSVSNAASVNLGYVPPKFVVFKDGQISNDYPNYLVVWQPTDSGWTAQQWLDYLRNDPAYSIYIPGGWGITNVYVITGTETVAADNYTFSVQETSNGWVASKTSTTTGLPGDIGQVQWYYGDPGPKPVLPSDPSSDLSLAIPTVPDLPAPAPGLPTDPILDVPNVTIPDVPSSPTPAPPVIPDGYSFKGYNQLNASGFFDGQGTYVKSPGNSGSSTVTKMGVNFTFNWSGNSRSVTLSIADASNLPDTVYLAVQTGSSGQTGNNAYAIFAVKTSDLLNGSHTLQLPAGSGLFIFPLDTQAHIDTLQGAIAAAQAGTPIYDYSTTPPTPIHITYKQLTVASDGTLQ